MRRSQSLLILVGLALAILHFHSGDALTRAFIRFDDHNFIEPLQNLNFSTYFSEWLGKPNSYAFPLRDLTFAIDFKLSEILPFKTFWLTNFALYVVFIAVWLQISKTLTDSQKKEDQSSLLPTLWPLWLVAAFHPATLEMVQWVSNRKHLLVGLLTSIGTARIVARWRKSQRPSENDYFFLLFLMMASWLCWPSGILWIFWGLASFWILGLRNAGLRWSLGAATGFTLIALSLTREANSDFAKPASDWGVGIRFGLEGIGRGFFTLLLPFWRAPYYRLGAWQNYTGMALLLAFVGGMGFLIRKQLRIRPSQRDPRVDPRFAVLLLALSVALLLPTGNIFLTYNEFVWADRYLFLPLFPLVFGVGLLIPPAILKKGRIPLLLCAGVFYVISWISVPVWHSAADLFEHCSENENSAKCVHLAVEARFDESECRQAPYHFLRARKLSEEFALKDDFVFRTEMPLYESICAAQAPLPFSELERMLADIRKTYRTPYYAVVGEILILLQIGQRERALQKAFQTFLDPQQPIPESSGKILSLLTGITEGLCVVAQIPEKNSGHPSTLDRQAPLARECEGRRQSWMQRIPVQSLKEKQKAWGFNRTIEAYNRSQKAPSHAAPQAKLRTFHRFHLEASPSSPPEA